MIVESVEIELLSIDGPVSQELNNQERENAKDVMISILFFIILSMLSYML